VKVVLVVVPTPREQNISAFWDKRKGPLLARLSEQSSLNIEPLCTTSLTQSDNSINQIRKVCRLQRQLMLCGANEE
jgi:hypothetical protein